MEVGKGRRITDMHSNLDGNNEMHSYRAGLSTLLRFLYLNDATQKLLMAIPPI